MSKYIKLENAIHAIAENMAQEANLKEHCNEPTFCAGEFLVEAEMLVKNLPTIEVSEDCISRADLPKELNGVVLADCEKIVTEFLVEHECDEIWHTVRALRDFYDWTMDAPSVVPKKRTGKPDFANCEKCSKIYGTLGCCSTVSNEWVYSCLEGMTDYAYTRGYKDGAEQSRATGKWIPVSERLPENGYWLWSATSGEVKKDFYWEGHWELAEKFGYEVVAWMPLPKPYRESEE